MICNECETVAHCMKHGCIPKQPAPVQEPDWNNRLNDLVDIFKDVDQCGPLLGMGAPPTGSCTGAVAWIPITEWRWNNNAGTWEGLTDTTPPAAQPAPFDEGLVGIWLEMGAPETFKNVTVKEMLIALRYFSAAQPAPDLQAELDATNRQVEILSDALAESRREVAALKAVQEPVAHCEAGPEHCQQCHKESLPTYGSEEIRKLREVIQSQSEIIKGHENGTVAAKAIRDRGQA